MKDISWIQPYYHIILGMIPTAHKSFLDVGAGNGIMGYIISVTRDIQKLEAVEPFNYKLDHFTKVYRMTWQEWFKDNRETYDTLISTECIEHMDKVDALDFLRQVLIVANNVVIATPKIFEKQAEYDGNKYQSHKCIITKDEFESLGYKVTEYNDSLIGWNHI